MADGFIQVPSDSVGKKVATQELQRPDTTTVERQEMVISQVDDHTIASLLQELILEVRDMKFRLLSALH